MPVSRSRLLLLLVLVVPLGLAAQPVDASPGSGPDVGLYFSSSPFDVNEQPDAVFVAWSDTGAEIEAGLLYPDDGTFVAFTTVTTPLGSVTNLATGSGGPPNDRRAYVAWVGGSLELYVMVYDASGQVVTPPQVIGSAVQVTPMEFAGTDAGTFLTLAWEPGFWWDPVVLRLDLFGDVLEEILPEDLPSPRQTLGVSVAAVDPTTFLSLYVASDAGDGAGVSLRSYGAKGPVAPSPIELFQSIQGRYQPYAIPFQPQGQLPFGFLAIPFLSATEGTDLRLARADFGPQVVELGPSLKELSPTFSGFADDVAGLAGDPRAVVVWTEMVRDPDCVCSIPPPIRVEFLAQVVETTSPFTVSLDPIQAYLWEDGDPAGPPLTTPQIAASTRRSGRFTLLWSDDDVLRYTTVDVDATSAVDPPVRSDGLAALMPARPNPFFDNTSIRYRLQREMHVRLTVHDLQGRQVADLVDALVPAGEHQISWSGPGGTRGQVGTGYLIRLQAGNSVVSQKLVRLE